MAVEHALPLSQKAAQLFAERGIESARLEAELLLAHVLGIKRLDLYLQFERPLTESELEQFRSLVRRRLKREPLQYITGGVHFRDITLRVDRRALIPRPETEVLVGAVVGFVKDRGRTTRILDIGTGSGAIALSIAHECNNVSVVATDVSDDALALARENASAIGATVEFRAGSLFNAVDTDERFDVVVSNPPYVTTAEREALQPEVREWEPNGALLGGADGLDVVRELVEAAPAHMTESALLALEIGATQAEEVQALVASTTSFENIRVIRDLAGRERIVTAIRRKRDA